MKMRTYLWQQLCARYFKNRLADADTRIIV